MNDAIITETRGGLTVHVCADCKAWAHEGDKVRHSKRCDTPRAQVGISATAEPEAAKTAPTKPAQYKPGSTVLSEPQRALLAALLPVSTTSEAQGLRGYLAGYIQPEDLAPALALAVGCFVRKDPARDGRALRPSGAPAVSAEQRAEIRRLAEMAGVVLS